MLPSRWGHLVRYGLLGTALVGGTARAEPCDRNGDRSVAAVIGIELSPKLRLVGGIEGRQCLSPKTDAVLRVEIGGGLRFIGAARARPFEDGTDSTEEDLGVEAGAGIDTDGVFAAHLAAMYGTHPAYLAVQGWLPLEGTRGPSRLGLLFGFAPEPGDHPMIVNGRALRRGGAMVVPGACVRDVRDAELCAVRDYFAAAARLEFSSVWTFLRLARELAMLGAPADLVARALDAADDEVRHAELCSGAAGGVALAALPAVLAAPRGDVSLAMLAREAWVDGCLNEGIAAIEARFAAESAPWLHAIATDEGRHAELSWAVLAWIAAIAPEVAREAVAVTPRAPRAIVRDAALARHGVPTADMTAAAAADARAAAATRLSDLRAMTRA